MSLGKKETNDPIGSNVTKAKPSQFLPMHI
jgi:hypothetical protein